MSDLAYPIGKFTAPATFSDEFRTACIVRVAEVPARLRDAVRGLTEAQLDTPYRPGGWSVRQVVHHVPDSHMNAYVRFKLALTEDVPLIKPYAEAEWAKLEDSRSTPIETSLSLLALVHDRWVRILRAMQAPDFVRAYRHPDMGRVELQYALGMYAWHGEHHVAHITRLREREGWR